MIATMVTTVVAVVAVVAVVVMPTITTPVAVAPATREEAPGGE